MNDIDMLVLGIGWVLLMLIAGYNIYKKYKTRSYDNARYGRG